MNKCPDEIEIMTSIPNSPSPTLCEFLRTIVLGPDGARRLPGLDLKQVESLAIKIAQADPDPCRPHVVLVKGLPEDFVPIIATLISGRPLMVLDIMRDEDLIRQACMAANALPLDCLSSVRIRNAGLINPDPDELALIVSTSGTTGRGKLWGRSQSGLMLQAVIQGSFLEGGEGLTYASLGHFQATAAINAIGLAMIGGANYLPLPVNRVEGEGVLANLHLEAPAFIACTPTIFRTIARAANGQIPWDLRGVWFLGERVRVSDLEIFHQVTQPGTILRAHYGSTETGNIAVASLEGAGVIGDSLVSSGEVSPVVELRIAGDDGRDLAVGETGRILVRSPLAGRPIGHFPAHRYLPATDGEPFFDLGDDGYLDAASRLFVLGRSDGVVKIGGVRVDASGLERKVAALSGVREVAVVGVRGVSGGDVLAVAVHLDEDRRLRDIRSLLREGNGIEKKAAVIDVGPFPVTRAQKIDVSLLKTHIERALCHEALSDPPVTPAENLVAKCWAEVLEIEVPSRNIHFEDLGGDSLSLLTVSLLLEQRYRLFVPDQRFGECRTVASQAAALQPFNKNVETPAVFSLGGEGKVVLACFAGIGGHAWVFSPLAKSVASNVEVLGVSWTEASAESLATDIKALANGRPVVPLGFSGGARAAWIVAEHLLGLGISVPTLLILDGSPRQSVGGRHLRRAILRWLRPRTAADRYLLALSYAGRRWNMGKRLERLPLNIFEVRCPDRPGNQWGNPELSMWDEFANSVTSLDVTCDHQRIAKPPTLPEITEIVKLACGLSVDAGETSR